MAENRHLIANGWSAMWFVVALGSSFVVASQSQECRNHVMQPDGTRTCYSLVFTKATWSVAERQCASRGTSSRLAVVSTPAENSAITGLLQENGLTESWLGASETVHGWQWLDGSKVRYQGCYKDDPMARDLVQKIQLSTFNSPSRCISECDALSFAYAGLQNGSECWCGNSYGRHGQSNAVVCGSVCPGDNSFTCGGSNALDVYAVAHDSFSNWSHAQPFNPSGNINCAVLEAPEGGQVQWMDYACSRSDFGALCDLGPGTATECDGRSSTSIVVGDRCVDVISDVMTQFEARDQCRERGAVADLVQLKTESDNAQTAAGLGTYRSSAQQTPTGFWIGLTRSQWSWRSGAEVRYTNWENDMPSPVTSDAQQCVVLSRDVSGRWINADCNSPKHFVCEDVNNTVPVTTTTTTTSRTTTTTSDRDASLPSSTLSHSATTNKSDRTAPVTGSDAENNGLPMEILIAIICGGSAFLIIVVIIIIIITIVLCRKRGRSCCCCCRSDPEISSSKSQGPNGVMEPEPYYFGVTIDDLIRADEVPVTEDVTYANVTTPPPDVVPQNDLSDSEAGSDVRTQNGVMMTFHHQPESIYADCVSGTSM